HGVDVEPSPPRPAAPLRLVPVPHALDPAGLPGDAPTDRRDHACRGGRQVQLLQGDGAHLDRRERVAKLMAEHGENLVLTPGLDLDFREPPLQAGELEVGRGLIQLGGDPSILLLRRLEDALSGRELRSNRPATLAHGYSPLIGRPSPPRASIPDRLARDLRHDRTLPSSSDSAETSAAPAASPVPAPPLRVGDTRFPERVQSRTSGPQSF